MTVLDKLNFVAFKPSLNENSIELKRFKLCTKIEEQLQLAQNPTYSPTQQKWITNADGVKQLVEVPKRVKRWWAKSVDGKINLVIRYGSKPIEFSKGKNAILLDSEEEVSGVLTMVRDAVVSGELDALIEQQAQFGRQAVKAKD